MDAAYAYYKKLCLLEMRRKGNLREIERSDNNSNNNDSDSDNNNDSNNDNDASSQGSGAPMRAVDEDDEGAEELVESLQISHCREEIGSISKRVAATTQEIESVIKGAAATTQRLRRL